MTARGALAEAGGGRTTPALGGDAIDRAPRLMGEARALTIERARLRAEMWRLEVELGRRDAEPAPGAAQLGVSEGAAEALVSAQRRLLELGAAQAKSQDTYLDASIDQSEKRASILREQEDQQRDAVAADEEELRRTRRLLERGVVPNDRLLDIRRAQVLSATRLLTTQSELSRVELEKIRLAEQKNTAQPLRDTERINRHVAATGRLAELESRLTAVREEMEAAGLSALAFAEAPALDTVVTVHRRIEGAAAPVDVGLDDLLEPGDVIEVTLAPLLQ
jgi:polysaccharide export outer membrane protein